MKYSWNLYKIYESDDAWESGKNELIQTMEDFSKIIDELPNSLDSFFNVTKKHILINELIERVYCYPRRFLDLNINDEVHKRMFDEALNIYNDVLKLTSRFMDVVLKYKKQVCEYLKQNEAVYYKRYYEILFNSNAIKNDGDIFKVYQSIRNEYQSLISNILYKEIEVDGKIFLVNEKNYSNLLLNDDRNIREKSFLLLNEAYLDISDEITDLYIRKLKNDIELSKIKGYKSLKEMKLLELELPENLIDNTIRAIKEHTSIMHDYVTIKKRLVGESDYYLYDSSYPKTKEGKTISMDEAIKIAKECLSIFGDDMLKKIESLEDGSIDAYPRDEKRKMNFTGITYAGIPYICLNYNNKLSGVRNLIHELGHATHLLYSKEENDFTYFEFSLFLTEVVAKVNEARFNSFMSDKNDEDEIPFILSSQLNSIFNQIMFTEFEDKIVQMLENGKEVNKDIISGIYEDLLYEYNGVSLSKHKYNKYGWLRIGHFIMQEPFYLYQYSIGTILANVINYKLMNNPGYIEKYKDFLRIGNKMNIIDSLKTIDIDLFDKKIFDDAFDSLNKMIDILNKNS